MEDPEPKIETPVIDIQDLERKPGPDTRVNNAGVKVLPQINLSKEDEEAREAIAKLEEQYAKLPPG